MEPIAPLCTTVEAFCDFIQRLPEEAFVEQGWGPKEVLAHLVFYHESYVDQIQTIQKRTPFEAPKGRFSDLNAQAVKQSRDIPTFELVDRLRNANLKLCDLYQKIEPQGMTLEIKLGAKPRTLKNLVVEIEAHIRNHQRKLEKMLRSRSTPQKNSSSITKSIRNW